MKRIQRHRDAISVFAGLILPMAVAAILIPFRNSFADTASALVLVAVVVAVASVGNRLAGYVGSISASVWFDFFLTRPYERLAITHRADIETAVSLFVVGLVVTELAARNRFHRRVASEESDYVGLFYYLAELIAAGATAHQVTEQASVELTELLHLRSCRYEEGSADRGLTQIEHDGTISFGGLRWDANQMGLPEKNLELVVQNQGQVFGRFILDATPGFPVSIQRRLVAVAIADQVSSVVIPHLRSA